MKISPHLCFDGQCEEAFTTYREILGGTIGTMMRYGDSPMARDVSPDLHGRIVHASLVTDNVELAGVDMLPDAYKKPQGFFVILSVADVAEAKRIFDALAAGGDIQMPFAATFWSQGFGVLADRFGIPWEINCADI